MDLQNMVLWSIGFFANRYRIPPPNSPVSAAVPTPAHSGRWNQMEAENERGLKQQLITCLALGVTLGLASTPRF